MQTFYDFAEILAIKRYSPNTVTAYVGLLISLHKFMNPHTPLQEYDDFQINKKIIEFIKARGIAPATQRQIIAALRLYYREMCGREINLDQVTPATRSSKLPVILNTSEIKAILQSPKNLKHKAMLYTVYGLGLRSGELIHLKITDFDKKRKSIHLKNAKGGKDRIIPYPDSLKPILTQYYQEYQPSTYVFPGQKGQRYSAQSLRKVFQNACKTAGIHKTVTLHSLRHAYATHLMDSGTDLRMIQKLLGHKDIKTTLIYTHVTQRSMQQVRSPLDFL
ncbi:Site-specific recombinase XerD [Nonlabens sp. Hel1_33_55]|uniref:tyrosine-type recombinase/integrase n=1 Tax=Nonlabens sp. Hel1_33_55 TaxID=1336802 RepID=UPI000875D82B|nr:tyrosine-type recombinase/integrase [Nonlabens sp. Hel1_33_55]SCY07409.1 Site-specific recombinase XerD [Nonlabens sp. Hel1_33_55]